MPLRVLNLVMNIYSGPRRVRDHGAVALPVARNHGLIAGCAIAAALSGRAGRGTIVAVVSGGNIDLSRFAQLVGAAPRPA